MRRSAPLLLSGGVAVLAGWALLETLGWPIKTALYPRAVGIPLLLLATAETVLNARGHIDGGSGGADLTLTAEVPAAVAGRRAAATAAWIGGFYLAILLIGFPRAVPLFVFAYLKGQGRESWITSLLLAAIAWLAFVLLFIRLLHLPFGDGLLWDLFRGGQ